MADVTTFTVAVEGGQQVTARRYRAATPAAPTLVLAHGAGAGQAHPWIVGRARALAALGLEVVTFNFLYTEQGRRLPDPPARLKACYAAVLRAAGDRAASRLVAGGKSMGGRIATELVAEEPDQRTRVAGLVLLGYPLHPPGKPKQMRSAHLRAVGVPMLFVQGTRDAFGGSSELSTELARLGVAATVHPVEGGDHSFKVSPRGQQDAVFTDVERTVAAWVKQVTG